MHLFEHEIKFLDHIISKDDTSLDECMPIGHYFSQNESMDIESPPRSIAWWLSKIDPRTTFDKINPYGSLTRLRISIWNRSGLMIKYFPSQCCWCRYWS